MDCDVAADLIESLPHLRMLRNQDTGAVRLRSVFPPDTDAAWPSFYTGASPAQHGLFRYKDQVGGSEQPPDPCAEDHYRGSTFWDLASSLQKRSCVVIPHNIFPGWPIEGVMVAREQRAPQLTSPVVVTPPIVTIDDEATKALNGVERMYRESEFKSLHQMLQKRWSAETEIAWNMYQREPWDLYFAYLSAVDGAQHYFWRFHEKTHPLYKNHHPLNGVVQEFYERADEFVGKFLDVAGDDEQLIILSDHGHGRRPTRLLNVYELLRQNGYLRAGNRPSLRPDYLVRRAKKSLVAAYVSRFGLPPMTYPMVKLFPSFKGDVTSLGGIDYENSDAYLCPLPSMKGYSYGGIGINSGVSASRREQLISEVTRLLKGLRDPKTNLPIVKWIKPRERVDKGPHLGRMPDILLEAVTDIGLASGVHCPLFEQGFMHRVQSGSHRRSSSVLYHHNLNQAGEDYLKKRATGGLSMMDMNGFVRASLKGDFQVNKA